MSGLHGPRARASRRMAGFGALFFAIALLVAAACVPIAASDPAPEASPGGPATPAPPTPTPGDFSLDPATPTPEPTPTSTPDPERIVGWATISGTGQSGEELIGEFEPRTAIPPGSVGKRLTVRLWIPTTLADGTRQPQASIVHSSRARRQSWIEVASQTGDNVRLYLHAEGMLKLEPHSEDADRITDTFPPGGPSRSYSIVLPFDLAPDEPVSYQFRVSNVGLSPILVEAALELTD